MDSRTHGGIAVYDTGNNQGSDVGGPAEPILGLIEAEEQTMNIDLMNVNGLSFLINVLTQ